MANISRADAFASRRHGSTATVATPMARVPLSTQRATRMLVVDWGISRGHEVCHATIMVNKFLPALAVQTNIGACAISAIAWLLGVHYGNSCIGSFIAARSLCWCGCAVKPARPCLLSGTVVVTSKSVRVCSGLKRRSPLRTPI